VKNTCHGFQGALSRAARERQQLQVHLRCFLQPLPLALEWPEAVTKGRKLTTAQADNKIVSATVEKTDLEGRDPGGTLTVRRSGWQ